MRYACDASVGDTIEITVTDLQWRNGVALVLIPGSDAPRLDLPGRSFLYDTNGIAVLDRLTERWPIPTPGKWILDVPTWCEVHAILKKADGENVRMELLG